MVSFYQKYEQINEQREAENTAKIQTASFYSMQVAGSY